MLTAERLEKVGAIKEAIEQLKTLLVDLADEEQGEWTGGRDPERKPARVEPIENEARHLEKFSKELEELYS